MNVIIWALIGVAFLVALRYTWKDLRESRCGGCSGCKGKKHGTHKKVL
ncbi:FeoB-associated Cys-rich membrane protein [Guggenheimella bovis]